MADIGDSLLKDICNHQIALLNLLSSDVNFALKANFPFYIEQRDMRAVGSHLKQAANPDGTATAGGQTSHDNEITMGATRGRAYDIKANAPAFINPSSDPLKASMDLREDIAQEINRLVNLGVESLCGERATGTQALVVAPKRASVSSGWSRKHGTKELSSGPPTRTGLRADARLQPSSIQIATP